MLTRLSFCKSVFLRQEDLRLDVCILIHKVSCVDLRQNSSSLKRPVKIGDSVVNVSMGSMGSLETFLRSNWAFLSESLCELVDFCFT